MVAGADVIAPPVGDNQMTNEGVCSFSAIWDIALLLLLLYANYNFNDYLQLEEQEPWNRGVNMGHGLNGLNRSPRGKLPIVIPEGQIRPSEHFIAAKYATEINIAARNHVPVLTHWKLYKDRPAEIETFLRILRVCPFSKALPLFRCNNNYYFVKCTMCNPGSFFYSFIIYKQSSI